MGRVIAKRVALTVTRETLGIFYWIGLWTLVMPSSNANLVVAWVCFLGGLFGVTLLATAEEWVRRHPPVCRPIAKRPSAT